MAAAPDPVDNSVHAKVAVPAFVGSVVAFLLFLAKSRFNMDLGGQEPNLIIIVMAITGWLTPGGST